MTYTEETKKDVVTATSIINSTMDKNLNTSSNSNTKIPNHIDQKHWNEWISSNVRYTIISKNVRSIHDPQEVDKLLNRNNKSRWKHSSGLVPCWAVSGVDPQTGEPTLLGVQVKPDTSILNKSGKLQKYLGASDYDAAPLFLDIGFEGFWQEIITNKNEPIIITEGAKKAGAALSIGYTTISIPGVSTCKKNGRLHEWIKLFAGFGRTFYLAFDNDVVEKKPVQNAMQALAKELSATGSKVMILELPPGEAKGMDDFISQHGAEEFKRIFESSLTVEEWKKKLEEQWIKQQLEEEDQPKCKLKRQFEIIRDAWGEGLRLNQMKNCIELAGQALDLDQIRLRMVLEFGEAVPIGDAQAIVSMLAGQNAYHPVNDYLENVAAQYPDVDVSILDNLATRYFGSDNELHNIYMKKTLLAAVGRIKEPGCRVESVPILVNPKQGIGKSTAWRNLFGDDWFSDDMGEANEKDERMKLHQFWCLEWSEFENVYKRKDVSALKKFITTKTDSYRTPYSRTIKEYPRRSILVGTTNEQEILADPTGSRRFWVIPVRGKIPVDLIRQERDQLWAAAYALYRTGENWTLTDEQEELREEFNKQYQVVDPWVEKIEEFTRDRDMVTLPELFNHLEIEVSRQDTGLYKRISAVMNRLDWESNRKRSSGTWLRYWTKKNQKVGKVAGSCGSTGSAFEDVAQDTVTQATTDQSASTQLSVLTDMYPQKDEIYGISHTDVAAQETQPINLKADPVDPGTFPTFQKNSSDVIQPAKFEEGQVYWHPMKMKRVKVVKLFKTLPQADVYFAGEVELIRVNLSELTEPPKTDLTPGNEVQVIAGKDKGLKAIVSTVDRATGIWLKKSGQGFNPAIGPFEAFQLKRV